MTKRGRWLLVLVFCLAPSLRVCARAPLVLQSDFGTKDGAVAAMKGVSVGVEPELKIYDLTHEIPAFNVWEGAYRLWQTAPYWPAGTVFVSVVDPGVGTARKSVVARAKNGQYFVTPDNGTLTLIAEHLGLDAVREIDEKVNRRPGSEDSYTFHGRDVYAYTGARLAAGMISFEEVGPVLDPTKLVTVFLPAPRITDHLVEGSIVVLDPQYGNVWTNITREDLRKFRPELKPGDRFEVAVFRTDEVYLEARRNNGPLPQSGGGAAAFRAVVPYANSFGDVPTGSALLYFNSLGNLSLATNQGNFAAEHKVGSGPRWIVLILTRPEQETSSKP